MRLATGFCASFRKASALDAAAGVCSVATSVPVASTGDSFCAISGTASKRREKTTAGRLRLAMPISVRAKTLAFIRSVHQQYWLVENCLLLQAHGGHFSLALRLFRINGGDRERQGRKQSK